jgi:pyroglutamyl-peptidase
MYYRPIILIGTLIGFEIVIVYSFHYKSIPTINICASQNHQRHRPLPNIYSPTSIITTSFHDCTIQSPYLHRHRHDRLLYSVQYDQKRTKVSLSAYPITALGYICTAMIYYVVTGFGPFQGVPINPTATVVNALVNYVKESEQRSINQSSHPNISNQIRTIVMATSYQAAQQQIDELYDELYDELTMSNKNNDPIIFLHLGVNSGGNYYQLEQYAYNRKWVESDIYDSICNSDDLDTKLATTIGHDIYNIVNKLNNGRSKIRGTNVYGTTAIVSEDGGRYVCNYIYYYSLHKFQYTKGCNDNSISVKSDHDNHNRIILNSNVKCIFIHVPSFKVASQKQQLHFITDLLYILDDLYDHQVAEQ